MNKSIATISSPQFINLTPLEVNPLMSSCEIKVLYVGENRNHTMISKEVATNMAKTLRGAPIVGYYKEEKEDFRDHGNQMILDDEGFKFNCLTVPYGFVSPDAKVWFQEFTDTDEFGNEVNREYLMTTGYLWTGQFEECRIAVEGQGKPHSMELDGDSIEGHWSTNSKTGMDFFIINDATFSKLCILGDDIEPCFEGSKISAPEISTSFTKVDDNFKKTLFTMMQELQFALKGGQQMDEEIMTPAEEVILSEEEPTPAPVEEEPAPVEEELAPAPVEEEVVEVEEEPAPAEAPAEVEERYALLEAENAELKGKLSDLELKFSELTSQYEELVAFKTSIEEAEKDEMIEKFTMLSDEDKADVIKNKSNYTLEEIESKLSVICVRKKVKFDLADNDNFNNKKSGKDLIYSFEESQIDNAPAWIQAVKNKR